MVTPPGPGAAQVSWRHTVDLPLDFLASDEDRKNDLFLSWLLFETPPLVPVQPSKTQVMAPGKRCQAGLIFTLLQASVEGGQE